MKTLLVAALVAVTFSLSAEAQMRRGGSGGGGGNGRPPGMESSGSASARPSSCITDPMASLERELPSLRIDLLVTKEQGALWESFERAVRDIAELGRARQKHQTAPLESGMPPPPALNLIRGWADDDRNRAEAMNELIAKLDALQNVLTEVQRKELDRRVVLSQTEPINAPKGAEEHKRRN